MATRDGGKNEVTNLHLLCRLCHVESEMMTGRAYWYWLKLKSICYTKGSLGYEGLTKLDFKQNCIAIISLDDLLKNSRKGCPMQGSPIFYDICDPQTNKTFCPTDFWVKNLEMEAAFEAEGLE